LTEALFVVESTTAVWDWGGVIRIGGAGSRSAVSLGVGCDAVAAKADGESAMK